MDKRLQAFLMENNSIQEKQASIYDLSDDISNPINVLYSSNKTKCENKATYSKISEALIAKNTVQKYRHNTKEKNLKIKDLDSLIVYRCVHCKLYHLGPYDKYSHDI